MARIRTIKPEFWTDEDVMECSPIARLTLIGMWNFADDAGRLKFSPKQIKAQLFPGDDISSDTILGIVEELSRNHRVVAYTVDGQDYLQIRGWHHQRIDKPQKSKIPEPTAQNSKSFQDHSETDPRTFDLGRKERKEGEEGRKEGNTESTTTTESNSARARNPDEAGAVVVKRFRDLRDEFWPTEANLPAPGLTLQTEARQYLEAAPLDLVIEHLETTMWQFREAGKPAPTSLRFCHRSMAEAAANYRMALERGETPTGASSTGVVVNHPDQQRSEHAAVLRRWKGGKAWFEDMYGPEPGTEGCRIDPDLIREVIGDDAAVQALLARRNGEVA